jgi:hypothetical protein
MKRLKRALWFSNGESRIIDGFKLAVKAFDAWLWIIRNPYNEEALRSFFEALCSDDFLTSGSFDKNFRDYYTWVPF